MQIKWIRRIVAVAALLAFFVVMLGAYTRLTNAGLGCPDWPGCYGHLVLPDTAKALDSAQNNYPQIPLETRKAWTEMTHRYAAGTLAVLIFLIGVLALLHRNRSGSLPRVLPVVLMLLVLFQAALGMWTVTLKLLPVVVMAHLLGGILIFSCLVRLHFQLSGVKPLYMSNAWRFFVILAAIIVFCQIALGGWVSANYAGIACIGFPQCSGQWLPKLQFAQGFYLFSPVGDNYQGGVLDNEARATIQFIHRVGAMVTLVYLLTLTSTILLRCRYLPLRLAASLAMTLVTTQVLLGIANVIYLLPLWVAVAHNGVAALLMATLLMMLYLVQRRRADVR